LGIPRGEYAERLDKRQVSTLSQRLAGEGQKDCGEVSVGSDGGSEDGCGAAAKDLSIGAAAQRCAERRIADDDVGSVRWQRVIV